MIIEGAKSLILHLAYVLPLLFCYEAENYVFCHLKNTKWKAISIIMLLILLILLFPL